MKSWFLLSAALAMTAAVSSGAAPANAAPYGPLADLDKPKLVLQVCAEPEHRHDEADLQQRPLPDTALVEVSGKAERALRKLRREHEREVAKLEDELDREVTKAESEFAHEAVKAESRGKLRALHQKLHKVVDEAYAKFHKEMLERHGKTAEKQIDILSES